MLSVHSSVHWSQEVMEAIPVCEKPCKVLSVPLACLFRALKWVAGSL